MKRIKILAVFLTFCLSLCAQSGLLITTKSGDTELMQGAEFKFGYSYPKRNLAVENGNQKIDLENIAKIDAYPPVIVNGTSETSFALGEEADLTFVGVWEGPNHTNGTKTTPHPGIWEFHNDGTFLWTCTDIKGQDMSGKWRYDPSTKLIVTDSFRCPVLAVVSEFDDMLVLKNETFGHMYSLKRQAVPAVTLNAPHIIYIKPDGFVVRVSMNNHLFVDMPFKYGVAYSHSTAPDEFEKVYAANCDSVEIYTNVGENWDGLTKGGNNANWAQYINECRSFGGDITLSGFNVGDKLIIRPFAEFSNGSVIYGEDLKVQVVLPPADGIFLGDALRAGCATFWYNKGFTSAGPNKGCTISPMRQDELDKALGHFSSGWEIPSYIPDAMFRYKITSDRTPYAGEINMFSLINRASGCCVIECVAGSYPYQIRSFFVNTGGKIYVRSYSPGGGYFLDDLGTTVTYTNAYLLPCKRVKVTW